MSLTQTRRRLESQQRQLEQVNRDLLNLTERLATEFCELPTRIVLDSVVIAVRSCRGDGLGELDLPARVERMTRALLLPWIGRPTKS